MEGYDEYNVAMVFRNGASWYERNKEYQIANARKHSTEYRDAVREYLHNDLLSHPCVSCGESDPVVLEFLHLHSKDMAI
jgi:hypothetical protein